MASKHELIVEQVIMSFSMNKRGRLYKMVQGVAVPINGIAPINFGPLKGFTGFSDIFGFEYDPRYVRPVPIFCVVEVKTKNDRVRPEQKDFLNYIVQIGGRAYVARESDSGYDLIEWRVE